MAFEPSTAVRSRNVWVVIVSLVAIASCSSNKDTKESETPVVEREPTPVPTSTPTPTATPTHGVTRRLFADGVPLASLPLSISIETLGGVNTVLLPRGASLPVENRQVFSTASDNQSSVEIHVVQGEARMAKDNRSLGQFRLTGIPAAPRGVPQIEVVFAVDAEGVLHVSAKDLATSKTQAITVTGPSSGSLSKAEIDKMVRDAK